MLVVAKQSWQASDRVESDRNVKLIAIGFKGKTPMQNAMPILHKDSSP